MFAVTHKKLGGFLTMIRVNPSTDEEPVPWLRKHLKPDSTFATHAEAEALRQYVGPEFKDFYQVCEVEP